MLGDCLDVLATLPEASVDAIVSDPPYGIHFMGQRWDRPQSNPSGALPGWHSRHTSLTEDRAFQAWTEQWASLALRVLKPGGYMAAMGAARLYHRTACGIQDAGFEIRDSLAWLYGSGFPKSHNDKATGRGTALKPAWEPVVLARKPLEGTVRANDEHYGTGYMNIDYARVPLLNGDTVPEFEDRSGRFDPKPGRSVPSRRRVEKRDGTGIELTVGQGNPPPALGRWPANVAHDGSDEVLAEFPYTASGTGDESGVISCRAGYNGPSVGWNKEGRECLVIGDAGTAARFFYCAKPSRGEKEAGLGGFPSAECGVLNGSQSGELNHGGRVPKRANSHSTVKPIALMRWLIRGLCPFGGVVLDPFAGSGTTAIAALLEGRRWIAIERDPEYHGIASARIEWWAREAARKHGRTVAEMLGESRPPRTRQKGEPEQRGLFQDAPLTGEGGTG